MPRTSRGQTLPFVIVVPPTDHYRAYEIVGDLHSIISQPLHFGSPQNVEPCGPGCPAMKYKQLPNTRGIIQHYPSLSCVEVEKECRRSRREKPSKNKSEEPAKNKERIPPQFNSKPRKFGVQNPKTTTRKPSERSRLRCRWKAACVSPSTSGTSRVSLYKDLEFLESSVVLKKLNLPIDYEKIRILPKDELIMVSLVE